MVKAETILSLGIVSPIVLQMGAETINALHQGMGLFSPIAGVVFGFLNWGFYDLMAVKGITDFLHHPEHVSLLMNQFEYNVNGVDTAIHTLSPRDTLGKVGGYVSLGSAIGALGVGVKEAVSTARSKLPSVRRRTI